VKLFVAGGGTADLIADVSGYYNDGTVEATGSGYEPIAPNRILDSRNGTGGYTTPWGAGVTRDLTLTGVPDDATAVVLNVTATNTSDGGYATLWPSGVPRPTVSNLNFAPGQTVPNLVVVAIGANRKVSLYNRLGTSDFIADLAGWYGGSQASAVFKPITPARLLDSRNGTGGPSSPWGSDTTRSIALATGTPVPTPASAVVVNVTATNTTASSFVTAWPTNVTRPIVSNLNFVAGQTVPNLTVVQLGAQQLSLYNKIGNVDLIADVAGYFIG